VAQYRSSRRERDPTMERRARRHFCRRGPLGSARRRDSLASYCCGPIRRHARSQLLNRRFSKKCHSTLGGNTAMEFCSCLFVSQRTTQTCQDYARITQFPVRFSVNPKKKTVRSRAFLHIWPLPSATAEFISESDGCRIQTNSPAQH
jgi:hypothetical protein